MYRKSLWTLITLVLVTLMWSGISMSAPATQAGKEEKTAIIVAGFGTTVPEGVKAITNISDRVKAAFPQTEVRITFTSNIVRSVWRKRQDEAQKWLDQGIPREVLYVKNIISVIGDLQDEGYRNIVVQPTHMFYMEQSYDLDAYVRAFAAIDTMKERWRPFNRVVMGRPALGRPGDNHSYHDDIAAVVATLADDARRAREEGRILLYMGHGNEHWSTGIYAETQKVMRRVYADVATFIGVVEGTPSLEDFFDALDRSTTKKVLLKPFMIVAGDHAVNDMAGKEAASWKSILEARGYQVEPMLEGLGSNDGFADIFIDHIKDVAADNSISLQ